MAITGVLLGGTVAVSSDGTITMGANVRLIDRDLGEVGQRGISANDPEVIAQVNAFLVQMLPQLSLEAGFPITMPPLVTA